MTDLDFPPTSPEAISRRLYLTRHALGVMEQGEFAKVAKLAKSTYNNYEKGLRIPDLDFAVRLCDAYELTLDWIYRGQLDGLPYRLASKIKEVRPALFPH